MPTPAPLDLDALRIFVRVAELASFSQAAGQLGIQKGRVSAVVQQLEAQLGARLLNRTTRTVRITPDGDAFYARCKELLGEMDDLQAMFQQRPDALRGTLRLDMSTSMARHHVIPRLPEFLSRHPLLELEISAADRQIDAVTEGVDCVVRVGPLRDSGLVARRLGRYPMVNCASPAYLAAHGTPRTLADLDHHRLVHYAATLGARPDGWEFRDGDRYRSRPMAGSVTVNNTEAYRAACLAGLGLVQVPRPAVQPLLDDGRLVEVLPAHTAEPMPVSLLYPHRRSLSPRLRALLEWLAEVIGPTLLPEPDR